MRNVFNQYSQRENQLTHAMMSVFHREPSLLRDFLRSRRISFPPGDRLVVSQQSLPGDPKYEDSRLDPGSLGLPDGVIFSEKTPWCVAIECKVQAPPSLPQLRRHVKTLRRRGFDRGQIYVILISPKPIVCEMLPRAQSISWTWLYCWLGKYETKSNWAFELREFMRVYEANALIDEYLKTGSITMFDGFYFTDDRPYSYFEAKRLLKLIGPELRKRKDLWKIGLDPAGVGRSSITGSGAHGIWDFLPLRAAKKSKQHTEHPHLTMGVASSHVTVSITVPNAIKGGFRGRLNSSGIQGFESMLEGLLPRLTPLLKESPSATPSLYAVQRHFKSQKSRGIEDCRITVDLRAAVKNRLPGGVKYQPGWVDAVYKILANKRSNIQFGIEVRFPYETTTRLRSKMALDLFSETWIAISPLLKFVL